MHIDFVIYNKLMKIIDIFPINKAISQTLNIGSCRNYIYTILTTVLESLSEIVSIGFEKLDEL